MWFEKTALRQRGYFDTQPVILLRFQTQVKNARWPGKKLSCKHLLIKATFVWQSHSAARKHKRRHKDVRVLLSIQPFPDRSSPRIKNQSKYRRRTISSAALDARQRINS